MLKNGFPKRLHPLLRFANIANELNLISTPKNIIISVQCPVANQFQIAHVVFTSLCMKIDSLLLSEAEVSKRSPIIFGTQGKRFGYKAFRLGPGTQLRKRFVTMKLRKGNMVTPYIIAVIIRFNY